MTYRDDPTVDLDRILALAAAAGLTIEEFLQAAPAAPPRREEQRRPGSALYLRVLADPLLMPYFKHLDVRDRRWLRWHMLTLLAVVTGGPSRYQGRDLHEAHAELHITEEAFDRVVWHLQATLQELEIQQEDQQAILAAVQARRDEVVTFEESS